MTAWVAVVDVAIAITLAEALLLATWHRATGRGLAPRDCLPNIAAGLCLMAALRVALGGAAAGWVLPWLMAAGVAHAADLLLRIHRPAGEQATLSNGRHEPRASGRSA